MKTVKQEKGLNKKRIDKDIREKLAGALADFRENLGEKEFESRIKKASKLISRGLNKLQKKKDLKKLKESKVKTIPTPSLVVEKS